MDAKNMRNCVAPKKQRGARRPGLCTPFPFPTVHTRERSYY